MKPRYSLRNLVFASSLLTISYAQAQSTWNQTAGGTYDWQTGGNWTGGVPSAIGATANVNNDITGAQTINLNGAVTLGTLNLGDSTTTFAGFTIAAGTGGSLIFDNGGAGAQLNRLSTTNAIDTISAGVTLNDTLTITNTGIAGKNEPLVLSGKITGTGKIIIASGVGDVALTNATNDYSGGLQLEAGGNLQARGNGAAFGVGTITLNGGTIDTGSPGGGGTSLTTTNANRWNGNWALASGGVGTATWNINGNVTLGGNVSVANSGTANVNVGGIISETGASRNLTVNGVTMTLSNANTYTGTTTVSAGTLRLSNTGAIQNSSRLSLANGTTLQLRSNTAATFSTPKTFTAASAASVTLNVANNGSGTGNELSLGGLLTNINTSSATGFSGGINVTGANSYSLGIPTMALYGIPSNGVFTVGHAATAANVNIGALTASTGSVTNTFGTVTTANNLNLTFGNASSAGTINTIGSITETTGQGQQLILKFSGGTWNVGNIDLKAGNGSAITAGTLNLNGTLTFGTTAARTFTLQTGATLGYNNPGAVNTIGSVVGRLTFSGGTLDNTSGAAITSSTYNPAQTWSGNWAFAGSNGANSNLNIGTGLVDIGTTVKQVTVTNSATNLTVGGIMSGALGGITKAGNGTLTLTGANTFTGALTVSAGTLAVNSVNNVSAAGPLGQSATAVTLGNTGGVTGTLQYNGGAATTTKPFIMATGGTGAFDVGNGNQTLTLNAATNATTGSGALTKTGSGGLTFTTAPGHTGGTNVNRGTLLLSGALNMPATGALTVNGGGNFSLADGTARNTSAASLTLNTGAMLTFDWNAGALDNLTSTAAATTTGIVGIQLNNTSPTGTGGTLISSASGGLSGATYYLANATNYSATLTVSGTAVSIGAQSTPAAVADFYWTGNKLAGTTTAGVDNAWALSNGTAGNWSGTALAYGVTPLTPGSAANLFFSNVQADKTQQTTVLGADMTVNSITIDDSTAVSIGGSNSIKLLSAATTAGSVDQGTGVGTAGSAITVTSNAANPTISANVILGAAGQRFTIASGKTLTMSGSISGLNGFSTGGAGTLVLSGTNFFTGGVTITGGSTLRIDAGGTIGAGSNALTLGNGVVGTPTAASVGNLTLNTSATVGAFTVGSNTSDTTTLANIGLLSIASGSTLTATSFTAGLVADATNATFTALGTGSTPGAGGTLTVNGNMTIGQGSVDANPTSTTVVDLSGLNTLKVISPTGSLTIGLGRKDNGTLTLANVANTLNVGTLSVGDSSLGNSGGLSTLTLGPGTNALQAPVITLGAGKASGRILFGGASGTVSITGAGGSGTSAITLASHNSATSASGTSSLLLAGHVATVNASTVTLSQASGASASGGTVNSLLTFDAGTFDATTIQMAVNTANTKTGAINGQFTVGGGAVTVTGNVLLASDTSDNTNLSVVTGALTINGGTVKVGSGATNGIYDATTATAAVGSSTTLTLAGGTLNLNGGAIGGTANAGKRNITNLNFQSGTLQNVLQINDGAGLTKTTAGTLILSGTNSYTGATSVNEGTLEVALGGSIAAGSDVTVSNSGSALVVNGTVNGTVLANVSTTISGTGTVNGAATINGVHAPGNSPGIQTFTNGLTYGSTATLNAEFVGNTLGLFGTDFDGVNVTGGTLTIDSLATLALFTSGVDYADMLWDSARDFTVIDFSGAGTSTGSFVLDTANAGSFASEGSWSLANTSNDIVLSWAPIPEPSVTALIGAFGGILLLRRRR